MSMKNSIDTLGNRTRDPPACGVVPQPTAPPRAPTLHTVADLKLCQHISHCLLEITRQTRLDCYERLYNKSHASRA
jgi:hypothetical protein